MHSTWHMVALVTVQLKWVIGITSFILLPHSHVTQDTLGLDLAQAPVWHQQHGVPQLQHVSKVRMTHDTPGVFSFTDKHNWSTLFTDSTDSSGGGGHCFPSMARVKLDNGNLVTMSKLKVRDHVQTGTGTGTFIYILFTGYHNKKYKSLSFSYYWTFIDFLLF